MTSSGFPSQIAILPPSVIFLKLVPMAVTAKMGNRTRLTITDGRVGFGVQTASVMVFETNDNGNFTFQFVKREFFQQCS